MTLAMLIWAIIVAFYIKNAQDTFIDGTVTTVGGIILVALLFEVVGFFKAPLQKQKWEQCWNWVSKEHDNNSMIEYSKMMDKWNVDFDTASDLYDFFRNKDRNGFAELFEKEVQHNEE